LYIETSICRCKRYTGLLRRKSHFPLFARQYVEVAKQALIQGDMIGELEEIM